LAAARKGRREVQAVADEFFVTCPYCGEEMEIYVEPDVTGTFVQDCEVCCNPWRVRVSGRDDDRTVSVTRADGSE
jgi:prolyl-tRNA synthetase